MLKIFVRLLLGVLFASPVWAQTVAIRAGNLIDPATGTGYPSVEGDFGTSYDFAAIALASARLRSSLEPSSAVPAPSARR